MDQRSSQNAVIETVCRPDDARAWKASCCARKAAHALGVLRVGETQPPVQRTALLGRRHKLHAREDTAERHALVRGRR